jgi:glutathione S-transferase
VPNATDEAADAAAPVVVWCLPPVWGTPSPSPFVIKVLTWLRMAKIPHVARPLRGPPRSASGKIPYIELPEGGFLSDSSAIVEHLSRERGVDLDAGLSPRERAVGHAVRRMLEEHTYFLGLWERWVSEAGYAHTARDYFRHLPGPARALLAPVLRRRMRRYLHGQGLGRHAPERIAELGRADIAAMAAILGDAEHLLGRLSTVDATALREAVAAHENLAAYRQRICDRWWSDFAA